MSIGVAIIGSGIFVQEEYLVPPPSLLSSPVNPPTNSSQPAVKSCPLLTLKAIYSRSLKSAAALQANVDLYSSDSGSGHTYHDLLLRSDIHAVIIALPILSQPEFVEAALAAGKHVLSEKPIAADLHRAEKLMAYAKSDKVKNGATWGVAENFRFLKAFEYGRGEIEKLGRIVGFRVKMFSNVKKGGKYFGELAFNLLRGGKLILFKETPWRKKPEYQGGFLLDGGVHFVAGTRALLGDDQCTALTAYSTLLQEHLPPVDTVNSVWQTKSGISGTFSVSFGTSLSGGEYTIACEKGSVTIVKDKVTVRQGEESEGKSTEVDFAGNLHNAGSGVKPEVQAWAEGIKAGKSNPKQAPEQALADLEILEKMLKSGEASGQPQTLKYQA